jgi:transposase
MKTTKKHSHRKQFRTIIGVDLGDRKSHVCVTDKDGNILSETTVRNDRKSLSQLADSYKGSLFAIEVGTHSPWISRLLEKRGCPCLVANARKLRAIYANDRKCDMLDARMLAKLARVDPDLLSPIEHGCEEDQIHRMAITLRDSLVRQRVNMVSSIRCTLKSLGLRLPACSTVSFAKRCREEMEESPLFHAVEASLKALEQINASIKQYEKHISETAAEHHPETKLLQQIAGVGPITSLSFVLAVGDPERFEDPRDVGAYFGLVPRRDQSGDTDKELPISKAGNGDVRRLLVQAAHYILGAFGPDCDLREYGSRLIAKGGKAAKRKAVVATARKLAVLMLVLWKTGQTYEPMRNSGTEVSADHKVA